MNKKLKSLSKNDLVRRLDKSNMLVTAWMKATIITAAELCIINPDNDLFVNSDMFTESTLKHILNVAKIRIEPIKKKIDEIEYSKEGNRVERVSIKEVEKNIDKVLKIMEEETNKIK